MMIPAFRGYLGVNAQPGGNKILSPAFFDTRPPPAVPSSRRLSRIAKGLLTRCSKRALARIAKGGGLIDRQRGGVITSRAGNRENRNTRIDKPDQHGGTRQHARD